jgi:hypothetical protein
MRFPHLVIAAFFVLVSTSATDAQPVAAVVESSLKTAAGNIRQFAFDGNLDSYFASTKNPDKDDHFTLIFDKPIAVHKVTLFAGDPKGSDGFGPGNIEASSDGKEFKVVVNLHADKKLVVEFNEKSPIKALRIKPIGPWKHPLIVREIQIESEPKVVAFKYPIEFNVDVSDAPEMKEWADKVARICERNYTMINEELISEGFKPRTQITMTLKSDYKGVAAAGGGRITGSVKYFKSRPDDIGAMIHETVHCVQAYRTRGPGWLVEGIADYVRFFKYEPGKIGKIAKDPHYNGSYRTTAAFLEFVTQKYDKDLVKKLNKAMREGEYREEMWRGLTKKTLKELDDEWRASLKIGAKTDASVAIQIEKATPPANVTMIRVESGSAEAMAEALRLLLAELHPDVALRGPSTENERDKKEKKALKVRIAAAADCVVVVTEDVKLKNEIIQLARLLDSTPPICEPTSLPLKHAKAAQVAALLDELFNGKADKERKSTPRIHVVADLKVNALLIRASTLDQFTIRNLLENVIDTPAGDMNRKLER